MKIPEKRVFYIIIDQLPGHWEESVKIEGTQLPPVNVKGYHEVGLIPNFSYLIKSGLWVKRAWNRGGCDTAHGLRYLSTGSYEEPLYDDSYWKSGIEERKNFKESFFEYVKEYYGKEFKCATFSHGGWSRRGYLYTSGLTVSLYKPSDEQKWRDYVYPYIVDNPDFNLITLYLSDFDAISYCPSYQKPIPNKYSSKHAGILALDRLLGEIVNTLKSSKYWDRTYIVVASDHGYHLGCSVAKGMGIKTNNWCCDHPPPWDCEVWNFEEDKPTGIYSGGPRRITFIVSGGGLEEEYRGKVIEEAEIIDVIPTIADILDVPYECEGKSIFKYKMYQNAP